MKSRLRVLSLSLLLLVVVFAAATPSWAQDRPWINKTANKSIYAMGEAISYKINYGYSGSDNFLIEDILPKVDFISASPSPSYRSGNILQWDITELGLGKKNTITITVLVPHANNITFDQSSSVRGDGFVNIRKSLSTSRGFNSLNNTAILYQKTSQNNKPIASASAIVDIKGELGTELKSAEHGSGQYNEEQISNLNTTTHKITIGKDIFVTHKPSTFRLPNNRTVDYISTWSDLVNIKNRYTNDSVTENYRYMETLKKSSIFYIDQSQTIYKSQSNFSKGIANIDYVKENPHTPHTRMTNMEISETYHGDFNTEQSLDSYGSSASYTKYANGTGFVSSDKNAECNQRSSEHGSGTYESEEKLSTGNIRKSSTMTYRPNDQSADGFKIKYKNKWDELLYTRDTSKKSEILERISSADYIQKEALLGPSFLGMTGSFNGTEYLRARLLNGTSQTAIVERTLIGDYRLDTAIAISSYPKYPYPHLNITKEVTANDGTYVSYRINITNDGNKTLAPVGVVDVLPEGTSYYSASRRPNVQGRIISWSLLALTIGAKQTIDLTVKLDYTSPDMLNRVKAVAQYENRTVLAEASAPPDVIIEAQQYNGSANFTSGMWRPPPCFNLGLNLSECDKAIQQYYSSEENTTGGCCHQIVDIL